MKSKDLSQQEILVVLIFNRRIRALSEDLSMTESQSSSSENL